MSQNLSLPQLDELLRSLEANDLLHIRGFSENRDFKIRWAPFLAGLDQFYVKHNVNNQGLTTTQRQNARTNIQALAKDVADTHTGILTQNGQLRINAQNALVIETGEDGTASSQVVDIRNILGGGMRMTPRGNVKFRSRGDSVTAYKIAEFQNNNSVETTVFGIIGSDGYTQVGIPASPSAAVLFDVFGKVRHVDATEADESATLGQVQALVAGAGSNYDAFLEFNELTDLWQVGFANDFLQFFEGVFSFNYTGGLSLEIGNDAVNDWFEFVSSVGILGYNFDKPVRVNGAELLDGAAVEGIITTEVPPAGSQFTLRSGVVELDTIFKTKTGTVTLETSGLQGKSDSPVYNFLTLPASLTADQRKEFNRVDMKHCSLVVPAVLVPNKPTSPLAVYADQAAMLADQASQVSGQYYEYTGSTSMWQWGGTSGGVIGNYTELAEIDGWETWGAKPDYLVVTGDAYLVGEANINQLSFEYHDIVKVGGVSYRDVVVCSNASHSGMNADENKNNVYTVILNNFNPESPIELDSIRNESIYGEEFEVILTNPTSGSFVDLGGGDSAFDFGQSRFFGSRAHTIVNLSVNAVRIMEIQQCTIICRTAFRFEHAAQDRAIFNNVTDSTEATKKGLKLEYIESSGQLKVTWGTIANTLLSLSSNAASPINAISNPGQYVFALRFFLDGTTTRAFFYVKSLANSIGFQQYGDERTIINSEPRLGHQTAYYDRALAAATSTRPETRSYLQVIKKAITVDDLSSIANVID